MNARFSPVRDVTHRQATHGTGSLIARLCARCGQPRMPLGGRTDKRTRQWTCAGCTPLTELIRWCPAEGIKPGAGEPVIVWCDSGEWGTACWSYATQHWVALDGAWLQGVTHYAAPRGPA